MRGKVRNREKIVELTPVCVRMPPYRVVRRTPFSLYLMMHTVHYNSGWDSGMNTLGGLHVLGMIALFVGIVFLAAWAIKTLTVPQLRTWGIGALIVGIVLCLLSLVATPKFRVASYKNAMPVQIQDAKMMDGMMDENSTFTISEDSGMPGMMYTTRIPSENGDAMEMSMDDMSAMLNGKTGDAFDKAFIEGMIPHHQGAIEMARMALKSAGHDEIKQMARDIISAQQNEIGTMQQWMKDWGYAQQ